MRTDPDHYFVPPYVGYRGWIGVTLDNEPDWDQVERILADAYALVAKSGRKAAPETTSRQAPPRRLE